MAISHTADVLPSKDAHKQEVGLHLGSDGLPPHLTHFEQLATPGAHEETESLRQELRQLRTTVAELMRKLIIVDAQNSNLNDRLRKLQDRMSTAESIQMNHGEEIAGLRKFDQILYKKGQRGLEEMVDTAAGNFLLGNDQDFEVSATGDVIEHELDMEVVEFEEESSTDTDSEFKLTLADNTFRLQESDEDDD